MKDDARAGWRTARAIARALEDAPDREILRGLARATGPRATTCSASIFGAWAGDAAEAFGDRDAASMMDAPLGALIEGIRILDDIQDEEPVVLPIREAYRAFARALDLTADLPLPDDAWRAAAIALGRGLHETARGQELETTANGEFTKFWEIVDAKTAPLAATAFEIGALAAGAPLDGARALTRLAHPFGRILQIGDDCNDALGPGASDWRKPELNLLMLYTLSGPHGAELKTLPLRDAQLLLLREGALAYALHAQLTAIAEAHAILDDLALPNPAPFLRSLDEHRTAAEALLRKSGVDADALAGV